MVVANQGKSCGTSTVHPMLSIARLLAALVITLFFAACANRLATNVVPLPVLPSGPVDIRVAYAINPRLPRMNDAELEILLESMRKAVLEHFGVQVRFAPVVVVPIASLFDSIAPKRKEAATKFVYDFKTGNGDRRRLEQAFGKGFHQAGEPLDSMVEFAQPYVGRMPQASFESFGARMAALQLERIEFWRDRKSLDGGAAIDSQAFNEYAMWVAIGYGDVPFELVLTNQLIVSVEYVSPAVHVAVRGGYSNGGTSYSRLSHYGTVSIWSTYAFTGNDDGLVQLRNGERYSPEESAHLAGLSGAHELGHQLLHLQHPFGNTSCLMNPVQMFGYREWAANLSASRCPLGSNPAVAPGAYKGFVY